MNVMRIVPGELKRRLLGETLFETLFALVFIGWPVWSILEGGWSWDLWWPLIFGAIGLLSLWSAAMAALDLLGRSVELAGTVTGKREVDAEGGIITYIQVRRREFMVKKDIYNWVSEGEEIVVTFGKHTKTVVEVRKLGAETILGDIEV